MHVSLRSLRLYHHLQNVVLIDAVLNVPEGSIARVDQLVSHIVLAERVRLARIRGATAPSLNDGEPRELWRAFEQYNFRTTEIVLEDYSSHDRIAYRNSKGEDHVSTVADILFHAGNHATHHRGQVALLLRQAGTTPPETDYLYFARAYAKDS